MLELRFAFVLVIALASASALTTARVACAEDEGYPRLSAGLAGGAAFPVVMATGDAGGYVSGNIGVRFNEFIQWDVLDVGAVITTQSIVLCAPACSDADYSADSLFIGSTARIGYFATSLPVNPYLLAGLGAGAIHYALPGFRSLNWGFAGTAGVGADIPIGQHFTAGAMYRFYVQKDEFFDETAKVHALGIEIGWR